MLLVDRLPRDAEGGSDIRPGPAVPEGTLDRGILKLVCELAERDDGGQPVGIRVERV
jgi:hypothetical protein